MQDIPYKTVSCFERELKLIKQDDNIFSIDKDITYGGIKYKKEKKTMLTPSGFKLYVFYTWKSKDTKQFLNKKNLQFIKSDFNETTDYISKTGCLDLGQWDCFDEVDDFACKYIKIVNK